MFKFHLIEIFMERMIKSSMFNDQFAKFLVEMDTL